MNSLRPAAASAHAPLPLEHTGPDRATPSLRRRLACWLYEGLLLFGVVFVSGYLFSALTQTRHALDNRHSFQAFLFVIFGIYFTWFWSRGQTLAMKTWHIRVLRRDGRPLSQAQAFVRYVLSWLWLLPSLLLASLFKADAGLMLGAMLLWALVWALASRLHPRRQFWHDAWAGSQLVDTRR